MQVGNQSQIRCYQDQLIENGTKQKKWGENMVLKPKQRQLLEALMTARTKQEAIKGVGISQSTAYRYMNDEEFQAELKKLENESLSRISTRLNSIAHEAVNKLQDVIRDDEEATPANHIQASRVVLEFLYRAKETEDLQERLEALEAIIDEFREY